ncbi:MULTISPECIES: nitroreductase family protein [Thermoanaerobacterium]|uniref:Nitroreductase n=1 Tax=Thermoanaerobacterium thermosaccharolyticum TaxID=1517 RepID=A0A223HW37_THETR|nr:MULTISPECIES: nitroreductase family protein [Thermoanaerobacterium]TCW31971.1 nitroreductase [Thermohydrogenium kirishiense]AST56690.1 nitroreductase [Thermoanaerobacterium thermosaccharolyticum]KAA5808067.1 nitroreductase family protein [Thermoanaerobacterium thermosaccharolyticum]MBE0069053.1 nitroreductase family protein [Thermoanaerobacterium thermosaccharolyticum]MBE0228865.1 nitroreductase family protein [Thermoanaerobacterium thermosaccharolyticum]
MKDLKEIFEERRSVNFFDKNKDLDEETLKKIIDLAVLTPSAFNLQPWEIIAVKSKEAKEKLYDVALKQPKILDAPVTLIMVGDKNGYKEDNPAWWYMKDVGMPDDKIQGSIDFAKNVLYNTDLKANNFAVRNTSFLCMSIMYAAKYYGVDSHAMIGFEEDKLKEAFGIPEDKVVVLLISLGYFDESKTLYPRLKRNGYEKIVKVV